MNRILAAIDRLDNRIKSMNGIGLNGSRIEDMKTDITLEEFVAYQNAQAMAHASGRLTTDEAQTIYIALGGEQYHEASGGWAPDATLAAKIIVTQVMGELMGINRKIKAEVK